MADENPYAIHSVEKLESLLRTVDEKLRDEWSDEAEINRHFGEYKIFHPDAELTDELRKRFLDEALADLGAEVDELHRQKELIQAAILQAGGDTGHYDDGHSFGWQQKDQPSDAPQSQVVGTKEAVAASASSPELGSWMYTPRVDAPTGGSGGKARVVIGGVLAAAAAVGIAIMVSGGPDDKADTAPVAERQGTVVPAPAVPEYSMDTTQTVGAPSCQTTRLIKVQVRGGAAWIGTEGILHVEGPGGKDIPFTVPPGGAIDLTFVENVPPTANGCAGEWLYSVSTIDGEPATRIG